MQRQSPILRINADILWRIFTLNTVEDYRTGLCPLMIAHSTSQVCSGWRNMILSSPSIWGKIFYLPSLNQTSNAWRNEVLRRSGNALLSITSEGLGLEDPSTAFFFFLLENHLQRMAHVHIMADMDDNISSDPRWKFLRNDAPNLRDITLMFDTPVAFLRKIEIGPLFSNNAPTLRTLSIAAISYTLGACNFSHVRHLQLSGNRNGTIMIFKALSNMVGLESLALDNIEGTEENLQLEEWDTLPRKYFLNLKEFDFDGKIITASFLLCHIDPTPDCRLRLNVTTSGLDLTASIYISIFKQRLAVYLKSILATTIDSGVTNGISVKLEKDVFVMSSGPNFCTCYTECQISTIEIHNIDNFEGWPHVPDLVLEPLSSLDLSQLTSLKLLYVYAPEVILNAGFGKLLFALRKLTEIFTDSMTLWAITNAQRASNNIAFPFLQKIVFCTQHKVLPRAIMLFLHNRYMGALQRRNEFIRLIDLSECDIPVEQIVDVLFLNMTAMLRVLWSQNTINILGPVPVPPAIY